jgi:penicillin-binding protein 2
MRSDPVLQKLFSRRAALLAGGKAALFAALAGRLYYLQVIESDEYTMLADDNRINMRLLAPPRGRILDRFGEPLASNQPTYNVVLVAEDAADVGITLDTLARLIPLNSGERNRILHEVARKRTFVPVTVKENLSWAEVARIEVNAPELPGIAIDVGQSRDYPLGSEAAHVVGYVAPVSESEGTDDPLLRLPGFRVGKNGAEKTYDERMRGEAGNSRVEVNAYGRVIRELRRQEGRPGDDLVLTIDSGLQRYASARLAGESAATVVMDIHGGEILALVSSPSFDPIEFNNGISRKNWSSLLQNKRKPLVNKAISGQYPPGSTFKMIVALAALDEGLAGQGHTVYCPGHMRLGNRRFHCWKRGGHGYLDMVSAIQKSCDVYFYDLARRLGVDRIAATARKFGLDQTTGIDLPGEQAGLVPTKKWKMDSKRGRWQKGEDLVIGIGQGYLLTTPLQLAVMTARIANGGMAVVPQLLRDVPTDATNQTPPGFAPIGVSGPSFAVVREGMERVTNHTRGTAYAARIKQEGKEMAGKTGTVQVHSISRRERAAGVRKNEDKPWEERDHALFVAFAPVSNPRYAISVVVEHGGSGSKAAAPIARDILFEAQRRLTTPGPRPLTLRGTVGFG